MAPGEELGKVLAMASPCIILIDELVAYGRKLEHGIPGGTLESNLSFIQTLTELAKATPGVIVAASVPESDMEIGGVQGQQVLARIQETMGARRGGVAAGPTHGVLRGRSASPLREG